MQFTEEHQQHCAAVARFVREETNPHVVAWEVAEAAEEFPCHAPFRKMGGRLPMAPRPLTR